MLITAEFVWQPGKDKPCTSLELFSVICRLESTYPMVQLGPSVNQLLTTSIIKRTVYSVMNKNTLRIYYTIKGKHTVKSGKYSAEVSDLFSWRENHQISSSSEKLNQIWLLLDNSFASTSAVEIWEFKSTISFQGSVKNLISTVPLSTASSVVLEFSYLNPASMDRGCCASNPIARTNSEPVQCPQPFPLVLNDADGVKVTVGKDGYSWQIKYGFGFSSCLQVQRLSMN